MIDKFDSKQIYCRKLGHHLGFHYCRLEKGDLPCSKIVDCWFDTIPIEEFLQSHFTKEQLSAILNPPQSKIATIFDLIEQAKNRDKE
ncbi:MAG: hypothetical protein JXJ04_25770 [Spirochaetales bacterium]|nr:hypothetical protein [Spirochaetales bacterium]